MKAHVMKGVSDFHLEGADLSDLELFKVCSQDQLESGKLCEEGSQKV